MNLEAQNCWLSALGACTQRAAKRTVHIYVPFVNIYKLLNVFFLVDFISLLYMRTNWV